MVQTVAWIASLVFMCVVAFVFLYVFMKSKEKRPYERIKKRWYKARNFYGITLIVLMFILTIYTLRELPYDQPIYSKEENPTIVNVTALQFGWEFSQSEFEVGEPIEFHVTSQDVNHGFGLYDEEMNIIAQTQAMPSYTNIVYITFTKPGTYSVLCLEYCGLAHHVMTHEITVVE
ncbi:cytochrome C oxidase subunit II [Gracilibacillus marinus]|jgi:cytochrome c oxidase subunit II|uniref:Cytochrome aa3 subunit 2 n=1 Tax=Gracilibacillus marinus TaxID=630535 RepID=A0ABV8VR42_9BACI